MQMRKVTFIAGFLAALYGAAAVTAGDTPGVAPVARPTQDATSAKSQAQDSAKDAAQMKSQVTDASPAKDAPEPGSPGDTLTREDKRMAYLVYKLLDKNGKIKGANLKRGAKLFYQNCRPCHGEDGMRVNVNPSGRPIYIGQRAREDMPTFWYQMNFGDEDRNMEAYYDEITLDEMKDIAGYAQTLP
ncbi:MAG: c-type cytochrome [Fibrobacter sp.]|nr:c-type cytochrome [Fibrobacter sp.]